MVEGRFADTGGQARTFSVSTGLVQVDDIGCKVGDSIPVLHLPNRPQHLMIWLPGIGLTMSFARNG